MQLSFFYFFYDFLYKIDLKNFNNIYKKIKLPIKISIIIIQKKLI